MEKTIKCNICGKPYVFHPYYAGDQSACPKCSEEARKDLPKPPQDWKRKLSKRYKLRENKFFLFSKWKILPDLMDG